MSHQRGASSGMLFFLAGIAILFALMIIFGGCEQKTTFYSMDRECLIVEQDSTFNCYKNHTAYSVHEGYDLDHARQRFNSYELEALKRDMISTRLGSTRVKTYPSFKNKEDYLRENLRKIEE